MTRKYTKDYRLDNVLTPSGKLKTVPVYTGSWYEFEADAETVRKVKIRYLVLTVCAALSLLYLLVFTNHMDRGWYVSFPAAISTIFLLFAGMSTWRLVTAKGPVTREHNDKTHDRMATMSLFLMILSGLCVVGCGYHLIWVEAGARQFLFTGFAAAYCVCCVLMFVWKTPLKMKLSSKKPTVIEE